jgi:hypothetical protein
MKNQSVKLETMPDAMMAAMIFQVICSPRVR